MNKTEIKSYFNNRYALNEEQKLYLEIHSKRFELILAYLHQRKYHQVLDIGPSFLSDLLFNKFGEQLFLMGFEDDNSLGGHLAKPLLVKEENFIIQDLNFFDTNKTDKTFDLIICGEVMEHLYTSPKTLFRNFYSLLNNNGCLIIQTPNAVALRKRLLMIFGKNPFEMPRENLSNPGHYREYTLKELKSLAIEAGFNIDTTIQDEYFEYPSLLSKTYRTFKNIIPPNLRSGITIILRKAEKLKAES